MRIFYRFFIVLFLFTTGAHAQGFTKLQDKFGTPSTQPLQVKTPTSPAAPTPATASAQTGGAEVPDGMLMLNGVDVDIKDMIKLIANTTGRNFIINDKVRGKITIISEKPMTPEMAYQAFLSALEVNGFTVVETPAGLLNIVPQKDSIQKPTDLYKEDSPITDKYITRIIQLSNISANDLSNVIKPLVSKNGNMFAYPTTNSIVITDAGSNIDHILKLVRELDQEGPQEVLEIIPIVNADAKDIATKITTIFEDEKDAGASSGRTRQVFKRGSGTAGQEADDVQAISKVIADDRTNSIIIMGTKRSIVKVKALIERLDRTIEGIEGTIHVYYLKHANAKEMAEVLNNLVQASSQKATSKGSAGNSTSANKSDAATSVELEGGAKITADEGTNSLIITASPKDFTTLVDKVIMKLDIVRPQVYLEAVVMALDVNKSMSVGLSGNGALSNVLSGGSQMNFLGGLLPLTSGTLSSIATGSAGAGTGILGAVSSTTIDVPLGDGTTASIPAVGAILQALQTDSDANVLSTPSIMTLDNEEAEINVGQNVPVLSGTTVATGGASTTSNVTREDVGIKLKITPQISESDTVRLNLEQEISSVVSVDPTFGPTLDSKTVKTVVVANNKQTIVIGGLIDDQATVSTQKVPFLGDIPVVGNLFRSRQSLKKKTNLLVFITPYIIKERADFLAILKKKIEERNAFVDMNYGTGQRKQIRQAIKNHAQDLLEFKCVPSDLGSPCASVAAVEEGTTDSDGASSVTLPPATTVTAPEPATTNDDELDPRKRLKSKKK